MKRATPEEVRPFWQEPGYTFSIPNWPPGFVPQLFKLMKGDKASRAQSQAASANREHLMACGTADQKHAAQGTMVGTFAGTPKHDAPKKMQRTHSEGGRQHGDKNAGYHFRGDSMARKTYAFLQVEGPLDSRIIAKRLHTTPMNLRQALRSVLEAGVIKTQALPQNRRAVAYALGTVKPLFSEENL